MYKMIFLLICTLPFLAWPASKSFSFSCRTKIVRGDQVYYEYRWHTYHFNIEIISDFHGYKEEQYNYHYPFIYAYPGERYSVVLHNPMPVRVAVNLMIDGLNSITGNPVEPDSGYKWLVEPNSSATIRGWQVSKEALRRFYFTTREDSYARWRSYQLGEDLTIKCGTISAAYFWNRQELEAYFDTYPIYEPCEAPTHRTTPRTLAEEEKRCEDDRNHRDEKAGTGMGEKRHHSIYTVDFYYDMGMYRQTDIVSIYYDFVRSYPHHHRYDPHSQFAPESPEEQ